MFSWLWRRNPLPLFLKPKHQRVRKWLCLQKRLRLLWFLTRQLLPKQVRMPIVPSTMQPTVANKDIPREPQEVGVAVLAPISAPAAIKPTTQPPQLLGTPTSYVTTSPVQSPGIPLTIFPPTPIAPPVITIAGPDVLPVPQHTVTDMGPPKQIRPRQNCATDTPRLPVSTNTANIAAIDGPDRSSV